MQGLSALDSEAPKVRFWQLKSYPSQNFSICDALEKSALKLKGFDFYVTWDVPQLCILKQQML